MHEVGSGSCDGKVISITLKQAPAYNLVELGHTQYDTVFPAELIFPPYLPPFHVLMEGSASMGQERE